MPTITANAGSSVTLTYVEVGGMVRGRETWSARIRTMGHILFPPDTSLTLSPVIHYRLCWGLTMMTSPDSMRQSVLKQVSLVTRGDRSVD
ncbi:hypothetical protein NQZ68_014159 [Dissostichus eleginoides]|nr:hypothetical protein NQZ68_014159 [Dissostichus eleginoides]